MYPAVLTLLVLLSASLVAPFGIDGVRSEDSPPSAFRSICDDTEDFCSNIVCSKNSISVTLNMATLRAKVIDIPNIHLRDRRCTGFPYDDEKMYLTWSLGQYICGTDLTTIGGYGEYKNQIFLPPSASGIIYRHQYVINVTCSYPLNYDVTLPEVLRPDVCITYIKVDGVGKFEVKMAIYHDISYTTPYTSSEVRLSTKENLYVGVYIVEPTADYNLLMVNCFSTPTNNFYDPVRYDIIKNKCRNPADNTIFILENGVSTFGKFYIQMFKFVGDYSYVYLHCQVSLCPGTCAPSCSGSKAASDAVENVGTLTLGPIYLSDSAGNGGNGGNGGNVDSAGYVEKASGLTLLTMMGLVLLSGIFM